MTRALSPWLAALALLCAAPVGGEDGKPAADLNDQPTARSDAPSDETDSSGATDVQQLIETVLAEQAAEKGDVAAVRKTAAFQQARAIDPPEDGGVILAFHPLADGGLVIATGAQEEYGERTLTDALASLFGVGGKGKSKPLAMRLLWLDANGAEQHSAPLPFACKGVTVAPDGSVIAVGDERVVVFSAAGKQVAEASAPHFTLSDDELAQLREEITEQHREHIESQRDIYRQIAKDLADLEEGPEEDRTPEQKRELRELRRSVRSFEARVAREEAASEAAIDKGLAKARTIHRVAASRDHLYLVANEPTGYGFGVWRCGRDFTGPEKIIDGLRGCCGQMDVQVIGDELVIAENSRHRVAVYGLDGEPRRTFGKGDRTDIRKGFGGCCNPMNACAGPDGSLLLSESSGLVKQFAADGTLVEILAAADVESGCKNSSIGFSADGSRIYFLDIQKGRVLVLEKRS